MIQTQTNTDPSIVIVFVDNNYKMAIMSHVMRYTLYPGSSSHEVGTFKLNLTLVPTCARVEDKTSARHRTKRVCNRLNEIR